MATLEKNRNISINQLPEIGNLTKIFFFLKKNDINWKYFNYLKEISTFNDEVMSNWFNINAKTLRSYRKPESISKDNVKEHVVLLISLYNHGLAVFGTKENFDQWLNTENPFLDMQAPKDFLETVTGIKFIDDRLTAIEYGDNV